MNKWIEKLKQVKPIWFICVGLLFVMATGFIFVMFLNQTGTSATETGIPIDTWMTEQESMEESTVPIEQPEFVYAEIKGAVQNPGVYQIPNGGRIVDLIEKANGFTAQAATIALNQAQLVEDQMSIYVPTVHEFEQAQETQGSPLAGLMDTSNQALNVGQNQEETDGKININTSEQTQLETLPGIGPKKAQAILDYRQEHGSFQQIEDLMKVTGIGQKTFDQLADRVTVQ